MAQGHGAWLGVGRRRSGGTSRQPGSPGGGYGVPRRGPRRRRRCQGGVRTPAPQCRPAVALRSEQRSGDHPGRVWGSDHPRGGLLPLCRRRGDPAGRFHAEAGQDPRRVFQRDALLRERARPGPGPVGHHAPDRRGCVGAAPHGGTRPRRRTARCRSDGQQGRLALSRRGCQRGGSRRGGGNRTSGRPGCPESRSRRKDRRVGGHARRGRHPHRRTRTLPPIPGSDRSRRRGRPLPGLARTETASRGATAHQQRGGRYQLRDARDGQPDARLRPREARRVETRRAEGDGRREDADAGRVRARVRLPRCC